MPQPRFDWCFLQQWAGQNDGAKTLKKLGKLFRIPILGDGDTNAIEGARHSVRITEISVRLPVSNLHSANQDRQPIFCPGAGMRKTSFRPKHLPQSRLDLFEGCGIVWSQQPVIRDNEQLILEETYAAFETRLGLDQGSSVKRSLQACP